MKGAFMVNCWHKIKKDSSSIIAPNFIPKTCLGKRNNILVCLLIFMRLVSMGTFLAKHGESDAHSYHVTHHSIAIWQKLWYMFKACRMCRKNDGHSELYVWFKHCSCYENCQQYITFYRSLLDNMFKRKSTVLLQKLTGYCASNIEFNFIVGGVKYATSNIMHSGPGSTLTRIR